MLYSHQQRPRLAETREFLGRSTARTNKVAGKVKFEAQANSRLAWPAACREARSYTKCL